MSVLSYLNRIVFGPSITGEDFRKEVLQSVSSLSGLHPDGPTPDQVLEDLKRRQITADYLRVSAALIRLSEMTRIFPTRDEGLFRTMRYRVDDAGKSELSQASCVSIPSEGSRQSDLRG